ncbi:uncharacterized protein LOC119684949 isoform X2 [Teleopsis dalmanni]|uniref:uncharacterized protein LOC119684949 isoform X2 n=1 Tax=Teleopsis dalmanni TaxID=139649 RepID=UPI0018CE8073|nr:uncharacterized protein LOC119684949 isoform X2 [Teleopsis dalmanni]
MYSYKPNVLDAYGQIKLAILVLCLSLSTCSVNGSGCGITLPTDMPTSEPVWLSSLDGLSPYVLFKPTGQVTTIPNGGKLLLVCPGSGNAINLLNQQSLELYCHTDDTFKSVVGNVAYTLNQLGCKSIPTSVLRLTSETCSNGQGYIFKAGFEYNTNQFASVFSICYSNVTENTFYTHNTVNGAAINFNIQESTRRAFRAEGMQFTTTATNNFYTINNQISRFESYFGSSQPYITTTSYLARGHLTPDADFIFGYEQLATYFYTNAAPEFQIVNAGNWIRVENLVRSLAVTYNDDLQIYNGYMGILQLPTTSNTLVSIYLDATNKIEAPKYYFKVVKREATNSAIVFITLNNPFATTGDIDEFCTNVCQRAGTNVAEFTDLTRGYTFCCELEDFKTHYADLPSTLTAINLLNEVISSCTITMPTDIPNPEPVYVISTIAKPTPELLWPTGQVTTLPIGSSLTVFCAGSGNQLVDLAQQKLTLTCQSGNVFYSTEKSQSYTLSQLRCTSIPTSDLLLTTTPCSNNQGVVYKAGFTLDSNNFLHLFTICYDSNTEQTLYSRSIINGATQNYKINESTRRAFRANGMRFTTTATNNFYTTNNQISRFENYFGVNQAYITSSSFLARGHLAPDADFVFGYEQLATYFYTNCAPEFQVINAGNWIRVENQARSLATQFGSDLLTFTSTLGILQLPTTANVLTSIYLDDGSYIEAPKWYYKILMHPDLDTSLVMITLNNPFAAVTDVVEFCTNVCDLYGINSSFYTDITRGYTFCCTLSDFQNSVSGLPTFDIPLGWSL